MMTMERYWLSRRSDCTAMADHGQSFAREDFAVLQGDTETSRVPCVWLTNPCHFILNNLIPHILLAHI